MTRKSWPYNGSRLTVLLWIVSLNLHDCRVVRNKRRLAANAIEHQSIVLFIGISSWNRNYRVSFIVRCWIDLCQRLRESCSSALTLSWRNQFSLFDLKIDGNWREIWARVWRRSVSCPNCLFQGPRRVVAIVRRFFWGSVGGMLYRNHFHPM